MGFLAKLFDKLPGSDTVGVDPAPDAETHDHEHEHDHGEPGHTHEPPPEGAAS